MYLASMTPRQWFLRLANPIVQFYASVMSKRGQIRLNTDLKAPLQSFYDLSVVLNDGEKIDFLTLRNKKVLLVNTASDCIYTSQYKGLQQLAGNYTGKLVVIAFPSNDFGNQEKGTDKQVADFCRSNFHISFPISQKSTVRKTTAQHPVFQWLTEETKNGWNNREPSWNFTKFLVDEEGFLTHYIGPAVAPARLHRLLD